jgi:phage-related protein
MPSSLNSITYEILGEAIKGINSAEETPGEELNPLLNIIKEAVQISEKLDPKVVDQLSSAKDTLITNILEAENRIEHKLTDGARCLVAKIFNETDSFAKSIILSVLDLADYISDFIFSFLTTEVNPIENMASIISKDFGSTVSSAENIFKDYGENIYNSLDNNIHIIKNEASSTFSHLKNEIGSVNINSIINKGKEAISDIDSDLQSLFKKAESGVTNALSEGYSLGQHNAHSIQNVVKDDLSFIINSASKIKDMGEDVFSYGKNGIEDIGSIAKDTFSLISNEVNTLENIGDEIVSVGKDGLDLVGDITKGILSLF